MVIFKYKVDDEVYTTDRKEMTPNDILVNAKFNPSQVYLIELEGEKETSFKDDPNKILHMHEGMEFITANRGELPVSC